HAMHMASSPTRKLRFCFVTRYYPPMMGSGAPRMEDFTKILAEVGHEVHVVTTYPPHGFPTVKEELPSKGRLIVHRVKVPQVASPIIYALLLTITFFLYTIYVALKDAVNIIVATVPNEDAGIAGWLAANIIRRPLIIDVRDDWESMILEVGGSKYFIAMLYNLFSLIYRSADAVLCTSMTLRSKLIKRGAKPSQVKWLPNAADTSLFKPLNEARVLQIRAQHKVKGPMIVWTGTFNIHQAIETLIKTTPKVSEAFPDVQIFLAGGGPLEPQLKKLRDKLNADCVKFLGILSRAKVAELIAAGDVAIVTMRESASCRSRIPMRFYEYIACGVPVVASIPPNSELAQIIVDNKVGIVVPAEDPNALASGIINLLKNPKLAKEYGTNGRNLAIRNYDRHALTMRLLEIARTLV
ncbi:MAG: glycosyltransferase family 4 protein, partial [Candidatus Bathyarchaeia archaeon]